MPLLGDEPVESSQEAPLTPEQIEAMWAELDERDKDVMLLGRDVPAPPMPE
jgi:hypothetical protein